MRHPVLLICAAGILALGGCSSGGDDNSFNVPPVVVNPDLPDPADPVVATIDLLTSNPQIPSDGQLPATITALIKDSDNNFVAGQTVSFAADSGGVSVTQPVTNTSGVATANITAAGDPTNRIVTITGTVTNLLSDGSSETLTDTVQVEVIGTDLSITGPSSLVQGDSVDFTFQLLDAGGNGIVDRDIMIASSLGNTLSAVTLTTDNLGTAQAGYSAINSGNDTLTATALGLSTVQPISVSDDSFAFTSPSSGTEVPLGTDQAITIRWIQDTLPVANADIRLSTTRGTLSDIVVMTDVNGEATVMISAANAGRATVTAVGDNGPSTQLDLLFVAEVPAEIVVQAAPFTVAPNGQSTITATVTDITQNLVKGARVTFALDDTTGGTLSVGSAVTDALGQARTFYTASAATSPVDGISVTATVEGTALFDTALLTVARRELFFTFGTGNELFEPNPAQYSVPYIVQVTDADGNGVPGVDILMSVVSVKYIKGFWCLIEADDIWVTDSKARCNDEDVNRNGELDPGEDFNGNGRIEAGNIVTVAPGTFVSDANGFGLIDLFYPQQYARWLEVELEARTTVEGTEFSEREVFLVPVLADDVMGSDISPPGLSSVVEFPPPAGTINTFCGVDATGFAPGTVSDLLVSPFGYTEECDVWDFPN